MSITLTTSHHCSICGTPLENVKNERVDSTIQVSLAPCARCNQSLKTSKIVKVYNKYRHLDHLLSDVAWLPDSKAGKILHELWLAVKEVAAP